MRVLMLGWEFPPFISGGLGTACRGLTDGLKRADARVLFVLPRSVDSPPPEDASAPDYLAASGLRYSPHRRRRIDRVIVAAVHSALTDPYAAGMEVGFASRRGDEGARGSTFAPLRVMGLGAEGGYDGDLVGKIQSYARRCVALARRELFDVIHAHDWMTYPAAMAISELSGRPMVAHVHATELDRSSDPTGTIFDIERRGMEAAARVLTVSRRTRDMVVEHYGIPAQRVTVVHNGIERGATPVRRTNGHDPTVLFLGRITRQKGPGFFLRAAARVAERIPRAHFVVAGAGDQAGAAMALARALGIEERVTFTGFLRGAEVERAYDQADVYVMPSVSEPFGLTALEAAARGVPVIVSRSSGVAEVLEHGSLKVDYWDSEEMAKLIEAVLTRPELAARLRAAAAQEIAGASWDRAARRCVETYYEVTAGTPAPVRV